MMSLGYPLFLFLLSLRGLGSLELEVDVSLKGTLEGRRGHLEKTFPRWGPNFHVGFDVRIKPKANWKGSGLHNILQLTTDKQATNNDFDSPSSRIPGVYLYPSNATKIAAYLVVQMEVKGTLHTEKYGLRGSKQNGSDYVQVDIRQKYGALKMTVDDQRVWSLTIGDQSFQDVQFWLPNWTNLPASDVANIKNVVVVNEARKKRSRFQNCNWLS